MWPLAPPHRPRAQRLMDAFHGNQFGAFLRVCMELPELFKQVGVNLI